MPKRKDNRRHRGYRRHNGNIEMSKIMGKERVIRSRYIRNNPAVRDSNIIPHYGNFYDRKRRYYENANLNYNNLYDENRYSPKTRASLFTLLELFKDIGSVIIFPIGLLRLGNHLQQKDYEKIGRFFKVLGALFIPLVGLYLAGKYLRESDSKILSLLGFVLQVTNILSVLFLTAGLVAMLLAKPAIMLFIPPLALLTFGIWLVRNDSALCKILGGLLIATSIGSGIFLLFGGMIKYTAAAHYAFSQALLHTMGTIGSVTSNLLSSFGHLFNQLLQTAPHLLQNAIHLFQGHIVPFLATAAGAYTGIGLAGIWALYEFVKTFKVLRLMSKAPEEYISKEAKAIAWGTFIVGTLAIAAAAITVIAMTAFPPLAVLVITLAAAALFFRVFRKAVSSFIKNAIDNTAKEEGYEKNPYILHKDLTNRGFDDKSNYRADYNDKSHKDDTSSYCAKNPEKYYSADGKGPYYFFSHKADHSNAQRNYSDNDEDQNYDFNYHPNSD